ncbi:hypothetical protein SAMN05216312_11229 [Cohnella sp. OV330]|uniref:hypothetical protein n=1 Tax=Cohnella sp. OV330 TaxID=1855288 RepID=UPI0008E191B5|nr:hypothetical protein [Cohnella sp. OV330]SFB53645.1 hypothetical protein SAMN05216312_11229 [Cohnella sp. OV330]
MKVPYSFSKKADALLINESDAMVKVAYGDFFTLNLPLIGPRPPYYAHPRYEGHYPLI